MKTKLAHPRNLTLGLALVATVAAVSLSGCRRPHQTPLERDFIPEPPELAPGEVAPKPPELAPPIEPSPSQTPASTAEPELESAIAASDGDAP